jgi:predicted esterase
MSTSFYSRNVKFTIESPYYISVESGEKIEEIWVVLHGYGQLAEFFLQKFEPLFEPNRLFVAPQGIHRFYKMGFKGRVVANWMTKVHRDEDIQHCNHYLNAVLKDVHDQFPNANSISALGFSQGAATLSRWMAQSDHIFAKAVFWGGAMAHDLHISAFLERTKDTQIIFALGEKDPLLTPERLREHKEFLYRKGIKNITEKSYPGAHEIDTALMTRIME